MFRNLSYKQKLKLVGLAALLSLFLCYRLSISRTIGEYHKYELESPDATPAGDSGPSITAFEARTARVEGVMRLYQLDTLRPDKDCWPRQATIANPITCN